MATKKKQASASGSTQIDLDLARTKARTTSQIIDGVVSTLRTVVRCGTWLGVAWVGYLAVRSFAGQTTDFKAVLDAAVDMKMDQAAAYVVAVLAGGGYVHERRQRTKAIEGQARHIHLLETAIDPGRSSSMLSLDGKPNPQDVE